ncbi:hypothetical protein [Streptomyces sp. 8N616]|uniref:hypothetical protein n=1 Tax=Streptomyces sp. 8N616 TaxID=3457414 RepID=UPI003FD6080A
MSTTTGTSAVRLNTATVTQYLASQSGLASGKRKAVLLRAAPVWDGPPELVWGERHARVATAVSPLGAYELVLNHLAPGAGGPEVLVVLTDREESELGADLLPRVHKQRVNAVDTWDVVRAAFGAQRTDERLFAENWAAEALLDATPPGGWPQLAGGPLPRPGLARAAAARGGTLRPRPGGPAPGRRRGRRRAGCEYAAALVALPRRARPVPGHARSGAGRADPVPRRGGPSGARRTGTAGPGLGRTRVGRGGVRAGCAALWVHADGSPDPENYRARGRAERWFGEEPPANGEALDVLVQALGRASEEFVAALLAARHSGSGENAALAERLFATVLDRAASLTRQFGAERAAATSPVLRAGLEAAFATAGRALADGDAARAAGAVRELERHRLATGQDESVRIERARMAQRLTQWLATEPGPASESVGGAVDRHLTETGWVDLAMEHVAAGGDRSPNWQPPTTGCARRSARGGGRSTGTSHARWRPGPRRTPAPGRC